MSRPRLSSWLNDHLAAANAGVELARRTRDENRGTDFDQPLAALADELEGERDDLRAVLRELGLREDRVKRAGVWAGEKLGRLKVNGQWRAGYNPASRMVELDGLAAVVTFNRAAWHGLAALRDPGAGPAERDLDELAARAASRLERLDELRARAAPLAFVEE